MTTPDSPLVIHGVLIAAGASRRLGQPKQLVKYKGNYLINHTINELSKSNLDGLVVVLGCRLEEISLLIKESVQILNNEKWASGMASSVAFGVDHLNGNVGGVLISLVDQYHQTAELMNNLIEEFKDDSSKMIISKYSNGVCGPPAIFPSRVFQDLKGLEGDRGAGRIIKSELLNNPDQVIIVDFENGHLDIDTPEDLVNLTE